MSLESKAIGIGLLILAVISGIGWWHGKIVTETRNKDLMEIAVAVADQAKKDADTNAKVNSSYEDELTRLRGVAVGALSSVPVAVRLCRYPSGSSPPAPIAGGTQPTATPGGGVPEVPVGTGAGPDIGAQLQQLALRADELSAQVRALLELEKELAVQ